MSTFQERTTEQKAAYVKSKTAYWPASIYAEFQQMNKVLMKLAEKSNVDLSEFNLAEDNLPDVK
jgi:hypothetical protein